MWPLRAFGGLGSNGGHSQRSFSLRSRQLRAPHPPRSLWGKAPIFEVNVNVSKALGLAQLASPPSPNPFSRMAFLFVCYLILTFHQKKKCLFVAWSVKYLWTTHVPHPYHCPGLATHLLDSETNTVSFATKKKCKTLPIHREMFLIPWNVSNFYLHLSKLPPCTCI